MIPCEVVNLIKCMKIGWVLNKIVFIFFISLSFIQCSLLNLKKANSELLSLNTDVQQYIYKDLNGEYFVHRHVGTKKTKTGQHVVVKNKLFDDSSSKRLLLEKTISYSQKGKLNIKGEHASVLRPYATFSEMWLNGEKYSSQMRLDYKEHKLEIYYQDQGKKHSTNVIIPTISSGLYCFFSQLTECLKVSGFFRISQELKVGSVNLVILWDGYPYFQKRMNGLQDAPIARGKFSYDGEDPSGNIKYVLDVDNQSIFYQVDNNGNFQKKYWVSQGITQEKI